MNLFPHTGSYIFCVNETCRAQTITWSYHERNDNKKAEWQWQIPWRKERNRKSIHNSLSNTFLSSQSKKHQLVCNNNFALREELIPLVAWQLLKEMYCGMKIQLSKRMERRSAVQFREFLHKVKNQTCFNKQDQVYNFCPTHPKHKDNLWRLSKSRW